MLDRLLQRKGPEEVLSEAGMAMDTTQRLVELAQEGEMAAHLDNSKQPRRHPSLAPDLSLHRAHPASRVGPRMRPADPRAYRQSGSIRIGDSTRPDALTPPGDGFGVPAKLTV